MIQRVQELLRKALVELEIQYPQKVSIEAPKNESFGDCSTNIAMLLAKECKKNPIAIANEILPHIIKAEEIEEATVAGAGFINIRFSKNYWHERFLLAEHAPLFTAIAKKEKVLIEFVSANPTGPLHVGHARGAIFGDALRRIYEYAGYGVDTEYYINDAGNQMNMLGESIYMRLLEYKGIAVTFPEEYYRGTYIIDIAHELDANNSTICSLDKEEAVELCKQYGVASILHSIRTDLERCNVYHSNWFSEKSLVESNAVENTLAKLQKEGIVYEKDAALWFASTRYGDDKDRVVKKNDGSYTYFASDIAYHANKVERGYNILFDVLGADHHGYVKRLEASVEAIAGNSVSLRVVLIQLVSLLQEGKPLSMSTRAGTFETLQELLDEVGVDAARFMFLSRRNDSPLEFDLSIVTKKTMENPVYYVQYAHARISSILRRYETELQEYPLYNSETQELLQMPEEIALIKTVLAFSDMIEYAVHTASPHIVTKYLTDTAELFHRYYARYTLCSVENYQLSCIRVRLCKKVQEALRLGLELLGISAPESM